MADLTVCQKCHERPAVYGDGLTWSLCSQCKREQDLLEKPLFDEPPTPPSVPLKGEGKEHKIVPGLTSVIIPVYINLYALFHYTGNCIGSLREHTPKEDYELVVIDNGSPIKPPNLQSYYADRVIQNEENLGVTKAWNQGIRMSAGEYIVLLNNDVQVYNGWLTIMKKYLDEGGYDLVMAHPMYSLTEPFARAVESRKILESKLDENRVLVSANVTSDFKDFSCVMFKRSLIEELGGFDEQFFNYCQDSDFFNRMDRAGKKWACCDAVATHHISDATGLAIKATPDIMNEDKAKFAEKWEKIEKEEAEALKQNISGEYNLTVKSGESVPMDSKYLLVRTPDTGDMLFVMDDKMYHHIKDPDTLRALGFEFGQEEIIPMETMMRDRKSGEEISMTNYKNYA